MKRFFLSFLLLFLFIQGSLFAFRVYPTSAQNEMMFDKANFPFIAENADGFNLQYDSFGPFSEGQVETIFNQFTNKNFINHGVYNGTDITRISTMYKRPSFANVTAMMLYNEAPAMDATEWADALSQNVPFPLITHCRVYSDASTATNNEVRSQILQTSGIMLEFQVTKPEKYDDAAALMKYCVDNDRMVVFLTTFQESPKVFISAYKEFFYYLKENLGANYLNSDNVIFVPNTYEDSQVFPETLGYGSTFGVAHWLIDQKTKTGDGYLQPELSFTTPQHQDYFENHKDLTVTVNVNGTITGGVKLYLNDVLVGEDTAAPYSWSGGALSDLTTGYQELRAVVTDQSETVTEKVIRINILKDPPTIPGFFQASQLSDFQLRNEPNPEGYIRHVYGNEWIDYKVNVEHTGLYDVYVKLKVQRSKQYGGTIILKKGSVELGRFTTVTNDPDKDALVGFTENPDAVIQNVSLTEGLQTLRVTFSHPLGIIKPQFYLYDFNFKIQGAADITFTSPQKNDAGEYSSYDAPANLEIAANISSPREGGEVKTASLYLNDTLVSTLSEAPYVWNKESNDLLKNVPDGSYVLKVVATDEKDYASFEEINLQVIARQPYNTTLKIPGLIKAIEYDLGGEGVGYHDFNEGHERGLGGSDNPRYAKAGDDDVEIEVSAGQHCVSAVRRDEWLSYTMSTVQSGTYDIKLVTSANGGKSADVKVWLNYQLIATVPITETASSGFTTFKTFTLKGVQIPEDLTKANVRLEFVNPAISTYLCFFRQFQFVRTGETGLFDTKVETEIFEVYPNPTSSSFTIDLKTKGASKLCIYSMTGQLIYSQELVLGQMTLSRDVLPLAGTYLLAVESPTYGKQMQKLVVY